MIIFDYDKYCKVGFGLDWAKGCKNHRVKRGFTISDNGKSNSITSDWESEVPDFMVGDRVVIKTWEQMEKEYGLDINGNIKIYPSFITNMRYLCGQVATIIEMGDEFIKLGFDEKHIENIRWDYTADMIELAYPTVRGNDKEKRVATPKVIYTANTVEYNGQKATCQLGDKFDLEKGIMLCLLKEKGIGYREIQELAKTAERKINHKFNTGDIVKVIDAGRQYDTYFDWFNEQKKPELKKRYYSKGLLKGKELRVVHFGENSCFTNIIIYACEDLKGNIYLIGERGLEKVED